MGLRTGPIQEGSQPGPRLDRKARAGKDPKAHGGFKANQACNSCTITARRTLHRPQGGVGWVASSRERFWSQVGPCDFEFTDTSTACTL